MGWGGETTKMTCKLFVDQQSKQSVNFVAINLGIMKTVKRQKILKTMNHRSGITHSDIIWVKLGSRSRVTEARLGRNNETMLDSCSWLGLAVDRVNIHQIFHIVSFNSSSTLQDSIHMWWLFERTLLRKQNMCWQIWSSRCFHFIKVILFRRQLGLINYCQTVTFCLWNTCWFMQSVSTQHVEIFHGFTFMRKLLHLRESWGDVVCW